MAQSTFKAIHTVTIDRIATSYNGADVFRDGAIVVGNTKAADRNVIDTFDLLAPDDGLPLEATATIVLAELLGNVTSVIGGPYNMLAERLTRPDYDALTATWTQYKTGSPWTTPGGDFAATPPGIDVPFPASIGDGVISAALAPFVVDALAHRGGKLCLHWRIDPVGPQQSQQVTLKAVPLTDSDVTRLRVTYTSLLPASQDNPRGLTLHGVRAAHPAGASTAAKPVPPVGPQAVPKRRYE